MWFRQNADKAKMKLIPFHNCSNRGKGIAWSSIRIYKEIATNLHDIIISQKIKTLKIQKCAQTFTQAKSF